MRFELARLFLLERRQHDAFERRGKNGEQLTREQWLRSVFGERIDFIHREAARRYDPDDKRTDPQRHIVARIGKETSLRDNDPEDHLRDRVRQIWRACLLIIDPSHHSDGQKVAIEAGTAIGSGFGNLQSLVNSINKRVPPEPYAIELHAISNQTNFWDYIHKNEGKVTSITLEVAMPNMFGGESSFEEDARRLRDREKARSLRETIENPDGLEPDTERMREAVSYATRGGGRVKAKAKDAPPYDSQEDRKFLVAEFEGAVGDVEGKTKAAIEAFDTDEIEKTQG
jgi:hypothetical protein